MAKMQEMQQIDGSKKAVPNDTAKSRLDVSSETDSEDGLNLFQGETQPATESLTVGGKAIITETKEEGRFIRLEDPTEEEQSNSDYHELQRVYEDACRDLKAVSRDIRDQSIEIRDLKRQNTQLQERNATLREQNEQFKEARRARGEKLLKSEKTKYIEHFNMLQDQIDHLQHERQKREAHMGSLTAQTREANEEKTTLEATNHKLQRQVRDLSNNLTECKDDLLRLQPTSQVSDNEVSEQYANLDQQIAGWIDDKTEDTQLLEEQIEKMRSVKDLPDLFKQYMSSDYLRLAKKFPDSQPLLLRFLIHCCLGTFILSNEIYLFGLDARNVALLQGMEEGMRLLEPRRDSTALRQWRSETLQGLLKMENFAEEQQRQAELVSQTLHEALSALMTESLGSWEEIYKQIVLPAIQLSVKLRLSTTDYRLASRRFAKEPGQGSKIFVYEIKDSSMIDITTQKIIRPDSNLKVADDGRIGQEILFITPALLRDQKDGRSRILICKPTVLVKLDEPMGKRSRGMRALGAWTPSWLGSDDAAD